MTNLDSILKSRDISLPTKVHLVKAMVFPVVMYGCENWTIKKAEHWRIVGEHTWKSLGLQDQTSQSSKEISPEYSLEGLMLKLKLPILWPPDVKNWLIGKGPDAGKDWRQEEKGMTEDELVGRHHWLYGHEFQQALGVGWWTGKSGMLQSMGSQRVGHDWATVLTNLIISISYMLGVNVIYIPIKA